MSWTDGSLTEVGLEASVDGPCRIVAEGLSVLFSEGRTVPLTHAADGSFEFEARAGSSYQLTFER